MCRLFLLWTKGESWDKITIILLRSPARLISSSLRSSTSASQLSTQTDSSFDFPLIVPLKWENERQILMVRKLKEMLADNNNCVIKKNEIKETLSILLLFVIISKYFKIISLFIFRDITWLILKIDKNNLEID